MKKIILFLLLYCFIALLLFPFSVRAASSSSENYSTTGQNNYGGGVMDSQNYSINGFLTDASGYAFVPGGNIGPIPSPTGEPTPTIDKNKILPGGFQDNVIVENILEIGGLGNLSFGEIASVLNMPLVTMALALSLVALVIPMLLNIPLLAPFSGIWSRILGFFGYYKKKEEKWGVVFDAETKKSIPLVVVQLFSKEYNKLLNTQITDKDGRFSFLVEPGKYYLRVTKKNYIFPSKIDSIGYHGSEIIPISSEILDFRVPMDPEVKTLAHRINVLIVIQKIFSFIRLPILVFGTIITGYVYVNFGGTLNLIFLLLYALIWIGEFYQLRKAKPAGKTFDQASRTPLDLTILRLFNDKNKLVSTRVSDKAGQFTFLINPGNYQLTALKQDYDLYKTKSLQYSKAASIDLEIGLKKQILPVNIVQPKVEQTSSIVIPDRKVATATDHDQESNLPALPKFINKNKETEAPKIKVQPEIKQVIQEPKSESANSINQNKIDQSNQKGIKLSEIIIHQGNDQVPQKPEIKQNIEESKYTSDDREIFNQVLEDQTPAADIDQNKHFEEKKEITHDYLNNTTQKSDHSSSTSPKPFWEPRRV